MEGAELASFEAMRATPAPVVYAGAEYPTGHVQTVGTAPAELLRFPLATLTVYGAHVEVYGIDSGNGVTWRLVFESTFRRLSNGPSAVGSRTDLVSHQNTSGAATTAGVATWTIATSFDGNDAVITVAGAAGRTVDWFAFAQVRRFRPGGAA
jgi:hypothetical protein